MLKDKLISLIFILSIIIYLVSPIIYNLGYNYLCGALHIALLVIFYSIKKADNYFDFDTLFLISYTVTFFIYPLFLYPIDPHFFKMFSFSFNEDYINKSTALSLIGSASYCIGRINKLKKIHFTCKKNVSRQVLPTKRFILLAYFLFCLFYITGGISNLANMYDSGMNHATSISGYIHVLLLPILYIAIVTQFCNSTLFTHRLRLHNFNKAFLFLLAIYCLSILMTGSRGAVLSIGLIIIWTYTYFYKNIKLLPFIAIILAGSITLAIVGVMRVDGDSSQLAFVDVFMDLIINNRNNFVALEYVDDNGITYGKSMLGSILRIIPLLSGFVHKIFHLNAFETTSSMLLTATTLGEDFTLGLGTSILADLFLSFGLIGVVVGMGLLGKVITCLEKLLQSGSPIILITYVVFISISVVIVRTEYFNVLNKLVYALVAYWILSKLKFKRL